MMTRDEQMGATEERHRLALVPGQDPYESSSQVFEDIEFLLYEVSRFRDALQAQADGAVDESDTCYWAQLVLDDRWTRDEGECPSPIYVVPVSTPRVEGQQS